LVMVITLILALSVALYALQQAGVTDFRNLWPGGLLVLLTLSTSFAMEVTIANLQASGPSEETAA
jgi:hypothetical protein